MTSPGVFTPYSTIRNMMGTMPAWIPDPLDQERILSYQVYEQIYWGVPETFKLVARGAEDKPLYVPTGRVIVETTHRYVAAGFDARVDLRSGGDASLSQDAQALTLALDDLFTRERFRSKMNGNKRYGLIRGDWLWHIVGDPKKPSGSRIAIYPLDPASYFPIWHPDDLDRIIGCHIVDSVELEDEVLIKRLTYRKTETGRITVEEGLYEVDDWGGPKSRPKRVLRPVEELPPQITALPVYHIRNFEEPANPFGSSELRGVEALIAAVNQTISDEGLALALDGLGVYATDAPPPTNDQGDELPWELGPGRVVEHPAGTDFNRIHGISTVTPSQNHIDFLLKQMHEAVGVSDAARGKVDVTVAESGISLMLQLAPMLARVAEKDELVKETHEQMFFDLVRGWFPTYEQTSFGDDVRVKCGFGEKLPTNRDARIKELNYMLEKDVISVTYYRSEMVKMGYKFPDDMDQEIKEARRQRALASVDPFQSRAQDELEDDEEA